MTELDHLMATALDLAEAGANLSAQAWRSDLAVSYKPDGSSLTACDLSIETLWRERIRQQYPSHGILGEEYGSEAGASAFTWVLDPIDGTRQFGSGLLNFASLISVCAMVFRFWVSLICQCRAHVTSRQRGGALYSQAALFVAAANRNWLKP